MTFGEGHDRLGAYLWGARLGEVGLVAQPLDGLGYGLGLHSVQGAAEVFHRLDHSLQRLVLGALDTGTAIKHFKKGIIFHNHFVQLKTVPLLSEKVLVNIYLYIFRHLSI